MRPLCMAILFASAASLAACGGVQTEATAPTVSYTYATTDDYASVARKADDYCEDKYDKDAVLVDRDSGTTGFRATFACR